MDYEQRRGEGVKRMRDRDGLLWIVVAAEFGREALARMHLQESGYTVLWVHYIAERTHARRRWRALCSYYPPFLFVPIDHDSDRPSELEEPIGKLSTVRYVDAVLWTKQDPHYLSPGWMRKKLRPMFLNDEGLCEPPPEGVVRKRYEIGQAVTMVSGPFAGFAATVVGDTGKAVEIEHEIFGRPFRKHYDPLAVEAMLGPTS